MSRTLLVASLLFAATAVADDAAWQTNWKSAFQVAKEQRKLVFVDSYAVWCGPCRVMNEKVSPDPEVKWRLQDYVLLRVDVDRSPYGRKMGNVPLPTYIVYDPQERDRFHFFGGMTVKAFTSRLDLAGEGAPFMLRAYDLFEQKREVDAWREVARGYARIFAPEKTREAYEQVRKAAESTGDHATAQLARMNAAYTYVVEKKPARSVKILQEILRSPVNKENEAMAWLLLGHAHLAAKQTVESREAFQKAQSLVAPEHAIARQAAEAIARRQ